MMNEILSLHWVKKKVIGKSSAVKNEHTKWLAFPDDAMSLIPLLRCLRLGFSGNLIINLALHNHNILEQNIQQSHKYYNTM